jgi:hypothetical protein
MALDFPASPTNGQTFTSGGTTWTWDGTKWAVQGAAGLYLPLSGGTINPGPLAITGNETVTGTLTVGGAASVAGALTASGGIAGPLTVNGNETVTGTLGVTGALTASGGIAGPLTVNGNETITGTLSVTGAETVTGALTPTGGIVGVINGLGAAAGQVGEIRSAFNTPGVTCNADTATSIISLSLTPGDWDIAAEAWFTPGTTPSGLQAALNTTLALPAVPSATTARAGAAGGAITTAFLTLNLFGISVSVSTTYILVGLSSSAASSGFGKIVARRAR